MTGWGKLTSPGSVWVGANAGNGRERISKSCIEQTGGDHPDVQGGSAWFIQYVVLPNVALFSYLVTFGELFVGTLLVLGLLTGLAAFFAGFLNASFLLAAVVSTNPLLFILATWLVLGGRVAGWWGLDRFALPRFGVTAKCIP